MVVEQLIEPLQVLRCQEVYEPVPHVALVLYVAGQVQEVVSIVQLLIDLLCQFADRVLVRNVADHYSGPWVTTDIRRAHYECLRLVVTSIGVSLVVVKGACECVEAFEGLPEIWVEVVGDGVVVAVTVWIKRLCLVEGQRRIIVHGTSVAFLERVIH